jgi:hypothetical protein
MVRICRRRHARTTKTIFRGIIREGFGDITNVRNIPNVIFRIVEPQR